MNQPTCSLSLLMARTDVAFVKLTIPHLVKMCNFPFLEKIILIDTSELSGDYQSRPNIGTIDDIRNICEDLLREKVIDKVINIDFSDRYREKVYKKHFDRKVLSTHNYRGAPVLGYIACIEETQGDYVLYFDNDLLMYQPPDTNWIQDAIQLMENNPDIVNALPLSGPPSSDKIGHAYETGRATLDDRGFYRVTGFTSRRFLLNRKRFDSMLPLNAKWKNNSRTWLKRQASMLLSNLTGKGKLERWEVLVTDRFKSSPYDRADMLTSPAWTLHCKSHADDWIKMLPKMIEKVESGWYPPEQAGYYDMNLDAWLSHLKEETGN